MELAVNPTVAREMRLLIVDDEESILSALRRVLRRPEWQIELARGSEEGWERFQQLRPEVVISDFRMPGMNGVELLAKIKDAAPETQRILLTGHADQHAITEAVNLAEIYRFISKPWNDQQLALTVRAAFDQFSVVTENRKLYELSRRQNEELRKLNTDLEDRVLQRTRLLSVAKREWEMSFDSIHDPLAIVQEDFVVRRANLAYARAGGKPVYDVSKKPKCHQFLFGRDAPCEGCPFQKSLESGEEGRAEIIHEAKTYLLTVYPMTEERQAVCSYRDVTDEREFNRRLAENEKMAAVGQLAGGVAHEINNPLGGILAFAQLMRRDEGRSEGDQESLALIEESALRCKRIVQSLLQFSRKSRVEERRPFELSKCVEDAVLLFKAQLKNAPKVELSMRLAKGLPEVHGDPGQLGQVVLNLLQNGLHALPDNVGRLQVETGSQGGRCFFRVADTGSGIEADHLPHIYEPHFTTKAPGKGTGLGLAISYRIVQDHGGTIEVDTRIGEGTEFTVYLPMSVTSLSRT